MNFKSPKTMLVVDPGKKDAGVAFFLGGQLIDCAFLAPPNADPDEVARWVAAWSRRCMMNAGDGEGRVGLLVCEDQQIYGRGPGRRQGGDPNDLIPLARTVGGVMARVDSFERKLVLPRIWTGGIPKEVRQRHFLEALTPREVGLIMAITPASKRHNVIDACHLGMWQLGRTRSNGEFNEN